MLTDGPSFKIPRSRVYQTHRQMGEELRKAMQPVLFDGHSEGERCVQELEEEFGKVVQKKYAFGVHSGTVGLFLALKACGVGQGDEVITVPNSDISTTAAISHCGALPVMCDILIEDYNINSMSLEPLITKRTKAILPVDLYGHPANVRSLREVANRHGLAIVEDAALALGASDFARPVGAYGDVAVFSFAPFKPLGCVDNGGMVVTDDPKIGTQLELLRGYGADPQRNFAQARGHQRYVVEGYNVPLDSLEAAILKVKLPYLKEWTRSRQAIARIYEKGFSDTPVEVPSFRPASEPTFRNYTVRVPNRDFVYSRLREIGIEATLHYTPPVHHQPVYIDKLLPGSNYLPITEEVSAQLINLPVSPELEEEEARFVVESVKKILQL